MGKLFPVKFSFPHSTPFTLSTLNSVLTRWSRSDIWLLIIFSQTKGTPHRCRPGRLSAGSCLTSLLHFLPRTQNLLHFRPHSLHPPPANLVGLQLLSASSFPQFGPSSHCSFVSLVALLERGWYKTDKMWTISFAGKNLTFTFLG